ncbi:MAG: metallophosphoesterase [Lachnospiraceae bacterium]|nr:metallophosphoesterase [Lachnospiraceae bacterium]
MSLFAIGDLHLHFQSELKAPNQMHDRVWKGHEKRFKKICLRLIRGKSQTEDEQDTLVLVGDHSWGKNLSECEEDFRYIAELPGRKILSRGNHDMFWDAKKTERLNSLFEGRLLFLQNNFYVYKDYALVGTKGFAFEGPFYLDYNGRIIGWDEEAEKQSVKLVKREADRLRISFEAAKNAGYRKYIMFLHYPPTSILEENSIFTNMAEEYGAEQVIYAHSHGSSQHYDSILGDYHGIRYRLVSGDYLNWHPLKILD